MSIKIFAGLIVLICTACKSNNKEAPKVLDNKKISIEKVVKRGEEDLLEGLYKEVADTSEILKSFESGLQELNNSKEDSLKAFSVFDKQNEMYYKSASTHAEQISDSILRMNIKMLISASIKKYDSTTARYDSLVKHIIHNEAALKDSYKILKIVYTLPLIEKYQQDNLPDSEAIEGFLMRQDEIIKQADTLIKK